MSDTIRKEFVQNLEKLNEYIGRVADLLETIDDAGYAAISDKLAKMQASVEKAQEDAIMALSGVGDMAACNTIMVEINNQLEDLLNTVPKPMLVVDTTASVANIHNAKDPIIVEGIRNVMIELRDWYDDTLEPFSNPVTWNSEQMQMFMALDTLHKVNKSIIEDGIPFAGESAENGATRVCSNASAIMTIAECIHDAQTEEIDIEYMNETPTTSGEVGGDNVVQMTDYFSKTPKVIH